MRHTDMRLSPALREAIFRASRSGSDDTQENTPSLCMGSVRRDLGPDGNDQPARISSSVATLELLDPVAANPLGTPGAEIDSQALCGHDGARGCPRFSQSCSQ